MTHCVVKPDDSGTLVIRCSCHLLRHTQSFNGTAIVLTTGFEWLSVDAALMAARMHSVSNTTVGSTGLHITRDSS